jgi:hypothetical protein
VDLYIEPEPDPESRVVLTLIETTDADTNWAMLFTFAPVAPISIALLPFGQLPLVEAKSALLLLSIQALTTGTLELFATAKPLTVTAPITNPISNLENPLFITLQLPMAKY